MSSDTARRTASRDQPYPLIVGRALEQVSEGPYSFAELLEAYDVMTDEFCESVDPQCSRADLLDWLLAIGPQGQERLLGEANREAGRSGVAPV